MLKTTTFFAGALLLSSVAFAQINGKVAGANLPGTLKALPAAQGNNKLVLCSDTLNTGILTENITVYTVNPANGNWGYVSGNNSYGDAAKANIVPASGASTVSGAIFFFYTAAKGATSPTSNITFKVWDSSGASGAPGAAVATATVPFADIISDVDGDMPTLVTFPTPASVTGNYYVGVELPMGAGDTLAMWTNTSPSASTHKGWEQWDTGAWHAYSSTNAWGSTADISNLIFPIAEFDVTAGFTGPATLDLATGNSATFTNTSTGGATYNWSFQGGTPSSSTSMSPGAITYSSAGTYNVELTVSNGNCTETFTQQIVVSGTVGISEELANAVKVYPNPATSRINVEMPGLEAKNIIVTNAIGQVVKQQNVTATDVNFVDVASLSAGMYYVQIVTEAGSVTKKVSVQK